MNSPVKAQCRNCGGMAPAEQFKLHYELRMMVCQSCFTGRNKKNEIKNQVPDKEEKKEEPKPAGWDEVDDYLSKVDKNHNESSLGEFKKIPGSSQVHYKCFSCKYQFKYDPFRKMPRSCPYCNQEIPKLKTFHLL